MGDAMMEKAGELIVGFKGDDYVFGMDVLDRIGGLSVQVGKRPLVVSRTHSPWMKPSLDKLITSLKSEGMEVLGPIEGAKPNAPREDVYRLQGHILHKKPDMVVSFESGSGIDACKAAATLADARGRRRGDRSVLRRGGSDEALPKHRTKGAPGGRRDDCGQFGGSPHQVLEHHGSRVRGRKN